MPETTPLIKAALNLRVGAGFDVYVSSGYIPDTNVPPCHLPKLGKFLSHFVDASGQKQAEM